MSFDNYPPGAANDPNAPYNKKDPVLIDCDECDGDGFIDPEDYDEIMEENTCPECHGAGQIEVEKDEDDL